MDKALYTKLSSADAVVASEIQTILINIAAKPIFAPIAPLVTIMQEKYDNYMASLPVSVYGSREAKAIKNSDKVALIASNRSVVDGVNRIAAGNRDVIAGSGCKMGAEFISPVVLEAIKRFILSNGLNPGEMIAKAEPGRGTSYVLIETGTGPTIESVTEWHPCPDTKATCTITGFTPGTRVWARATAVGRRGQKIVATPISKIVT